MELEPALVAIAYHHATIDHVTIMTHNEPPNRNKEGRASREPLLGFLEQLSAKDYSCLERALPDTPLFHAAARLGHKLARAQDTRDAVEDSVTQLLDDFVCIAAQEDPRSPKQQTPPVLAAVVEELERMVEQLDELTRHIHDEHKRAITSLEHKEHRLAIISHELKTPLTVIRSYAEFISDEAPIQSADDADHILLAANQIFMVIETLQDEARFVHTPPSPQPTPVDLLSLARSVTRDSLHRDVVRLGRFFAPAQISSDGYILRKLLINLRNLGLTISVGVSFTLNISEDDDRGDISFYIDIPKQQCDRLILDALLQRGSASNRSIIAEVMFSNMCTLAKALGGRVSCLVGGDKVRLQALIAPPF